MSFPVGSQPDRSPQIDGTDDLFQVISTPLVSIIVPTYKEAENLPVLIPQVCAALNNSGMTAEILIVDDNSPDQTEQVCQFLSQQYPVKLLVRKTERGLSSAVLHGMYHANGSVLLVMDADLSHPPEKVPELVAAVLEQQGDFVIGSRYISGGTTDDDWSFFRWCNSQAATLLSRGLTTAKDPMAGFFAISRQTFEQAQELNPIGYKIGLELIVKCQCKKVAEVPIHFKDRLHGESKLSFKEQLNYLRHLARLYRFKLGQWFAPLFFGLVGASGAVLDLILLTLLLAITSFPVARAVAILGAMSWNFIGNRFVTFSGRQQQSIGYQYLKFCGSCTLGAIVSWGLSTFLWSQFAEILISPQIAALFGILGGVLMNYLLSSHIVFPPQEPSLETFLGQMTESQSEMSAASKNENRLEIPTAVNGQSVRTAANTSRSAKTGWIGMFAAILVAGWATLPNWSKGTIDGLDQAHNVTTSLFFYDFYRDLPISQPIAYTYDYQRQYPALGLIFWPPLFHSLAGMVMLVTGPQLTTIYGVLTAFALLLTICLYAGSRNFLSVPLAVLAVAITVTTPEIVALQNSIMLEIPSLACCLLVLWMYGNVTQRNGWKNIWEASGAGLACAAIAYTKQPAVFVLLGLFLDVVVNHRSLLMLRKTWLCVSIAVIAIVPMAVFTWKFGKVNLAQSFGNQGNIYVEHHQVASRWTWEAWTYYLNLLPGQLPWMVLALAIVGLLLLATHPEYRKKSGVWFWSAVAWYLMFSYFDNKQVRFVAYGIPFLAIAATVCLQWLWRRQPVISALTGVACCLFLLPNFQNVPLSQPVGYERLQEYVQKFIDEDTAGNIAFFGEDHHLITAFLRLNDPQRKHSLLRGDDLLELNNQPFAQTLSDFRIRYLIVDPELSVGQQALALIGNDRANIRTVTDLVTFDNGEKPFAVQAFQFDGDLAESLRQVPLKSSLLGVSE